MKLRFTILAALALVALIIAAGSFSFRAWAQSQYDVAYPIRSSGTGALMLPYVGASGTYGLIHTTATNGFVQTTGSGLIVTPSPVITGTASIPSPSPGTLGLSASGTLMIFGTNNAWRNAP
jgi:hypothetical protein